METRRYTCSLALEPWYQMKLLDMHRFSVKYGISALVNYSLDRFQNILQQHWVVISRDAVSETY